MSRLEISRCNLQWAIGNHDNYDFPTFLHELRLCLAISKKVMAEDLGFKYMTIIYLEGGYGIVVTDVILRKLSRYFEVPFSLLQFKRNEFYSNKRRKRKAA